jgi:hypothetical protein
MVCSAIDQQPRNFSFISGVRESHAKQSRGGVHRHFSVLLVLPSINGKRRDALRSGSRLKLRARCE